MQQKSIYTILFFGLLCIWGWAQDVAYNDSEEISFTKAYDLAYDGDYKTAKDLLLQVLQEKPDNIESLSLLASTYSWSGQFELARGVFNKITSEVRNNRDMWISTVKNELYAKNYATALGLANKALFFLKSDYEVERLREIALMNIKNAKYPELTLYDKGVVLKTKKTKTTQSKAKSVTENNIGDSETKPSDIVAKSPVAIEVLNNRVGIDNSLIIYDQRYDPMVYSSISFRRQTLAGSIIPRLNYSNRLGKNGLQYDLDFYPKFSKRLYAYINYGYSNADIYPNHKVGGDLYVNLPGAIEFSAGGRYINFDTKNVKVITNSLGLYRGNYYLSLRSYVTPRPDNLTRVSGNILVRKYLKDAENYLGLNFGMGYSPELRQLTSKGELLAETLLFIESQRLSFQYQFTGKKNPNIYRTTLGVARQELVFNSGHFFWAVSAGMAYQVKF
ncbi:MAG: YaiO family outer membrane beta-barrel protein [Maribacter sp.]